MKKLLPYAVMVVLIGGCASWQATAKRSLYGVHRSAVTLHETAKRMCLPTVDTCIAERDHECEALKKCQDARRVILRACDSAQRTVLLGYTAIRVADKGKAADLVAAATESLGLIIQGLRSWGVTL